MAPSKHRRRKKPTLLSSTRPSHSHSHSHSHTHLSSSNPSSRTTRTLIRTHHTLQKRLSAALASQNHHLATTLHSQLEASGGLATYQQASLAGQSLQRGGDASRVLADWVREALSSHRPSGGEPGSSSGPKWRLLEVGALRVDNAIARVPGGEVERIDLRSRHPRILTQDFMQRPVPRSPAAAFDIVSLSLVLNYVGTAAARGDMLRRVAGFLRRRRHRTASAACSGPQPFFPGLFLVLPRPCVANSRYLDEDRLRVVMRALGFRCVRRKVTAKLAYWFWRLEGGGGGEVKRGVGGGDVKKGVGGGKGREERGKREESGGYGEDESEDEDGEEGDDRNGIGIGGSFGKKEVRKGAGRNNFAIVLV